MVHYCWLWYLKNLEWGMGNSVLKKRNLNDIMGLGEKGKKSIFKMKLLQNYDFVTDFSLP